VAFETVSYPGIDEISEILDIVSGELDASYPDDRMAAVLSRVCDPDSHGDRYIFSGTPGCPTCGSTRVRKCIDTGEWWPQPAGTPTHQTWESLDRLAKILQIRDALGLRKPIE